MNLMDVEARLREIEGWEEKFELNKWGRLYLKYLQEQKPEFLNRLFVTGEYEEHMDRKQEDAFESNWEIQQQLKKANPLKKDADFLETVQYNWMIEKQAEEFVMEELFSS